MRIYRFALLVIVLAFVAAACGGSKTPAESAKPATDAAAGSGAAATPADAAKGFEEMAKGLDQMAKSMQQGSGGDAKAVEPVSFRDLQAVLPQVSGWEMEKPEGQKMTAPFAVSEAKTTYRNGDASVDVKIVDSAMNQLFFAPFAMFLASGYEKETGDGYEKSINVKGNAGWEKWNSADKDGEVNVVVNKRFLVTIEGNGIADAKVLRQFADQMDLGKLAGLK